MAFYFASLPWWQIRLNQSSTKYKNSPRLWNLPRVNFFGSSTFQWSNTVQVSLKVCGWGGISCCKMFFDHFVVILPPLYFLNIRNEIFIMFPLYFGNMNIFTYAYFPWNSTQRAKLGKNKELVQICCHYGLIIDTWYTTSCYWGSLKFLESPKYQVTWSSMYHLYSLILFILPHLKIPKTSKMVFK